MLPVNGKWLSFSSARGNSKMIKKTDLRELFDSAAKKMMAEFEEARNIPEPHHAERGKILEDSLRSFLRCRLPGRYGVGTGFILGARGVASGQCDVIIYDALNCPRLLGQDTADIYPLDTVCAVVEVTSSLNATKLKADMEKLHAVRRLEYTLGVEKDLKDFAPPVFVFSLVCKDWSKVVKTFLEEQLNKRRSCDVSSAISGVVVLDKGLIGFIDKLHYPHFDPTACDNICELGPAENALLIWYAMLLHRFEILMQSRMRANSDRCLKRRRSTDVSESDGARDRIGASVIYPNLYGLLKDGMSIEMKMHITKPKVFF
jgi:hypothetical protein